MRKLITIAREATAPGGGCGHLELSWGPLFYYEHSTLRTGSIEGEIGQQLLQKETNCLFLLLCKAQSHSSWLLGYWEPLAHLKQLNFIKDGPVHLLEEEYESKKSIEGSPEAGERNLKRSKQYWIGDWPHRENAQEKKKAVAHCKEPYHVWAGRNARLPNMV